MREKLKNKKGISLIVLVITIIVIIILAAAVILTVSNNNPVEKANEAVVSNNEQVLREKAAMVYSELVLENNGKIPADATEKVRSALKDQGFGEERNRVTITSNGGISIWDNSQEYLFDISASGALSGIKSEYIYKVDGDLYDHIRDKNGNEITGTITIPNTVKSLGNQALGGYHYITGVKVPDGITSIPNYFAAYCTALKSVNIPEGVETIGYGAFSGTALVEITIPSTVKTIVDDGANDKCFQNCDSLKVVNVKKGCSITEEQLRNAGVPASATINFNC